MTNLSKTEVLSMMNASLDNGLSFKASSLQNANKNYALGSAQSMAYVGDKIDATYQSSPTNLTCWGYWRDYYYPAVIRESYPVYIEERAKDKGKQAFEIIKVLKDKKLVDLKKVGDFIDLMDELIKIL